MKIETILFDMDSTLNEIDERFFSKNYFSLLHKNYFADMKVEYFFDNLTDITRHVMVSSSPDQLNIDTFMIEMSKCFDRTPEELYNSFMSFYGKEYDKLKKHVKPAKVAKQLLNNCIDKGYEIVIATTPVFPEIAINKRLKWGNLDKYNYKLVTHAENMHFSKPREEYYLEILAVIGREVNECIMVGNEFLGDIVGPTKMGMRTFYCPNPNSEDDFFTAPELKRFSKIKPTASGTLEDFNELVMNDFNL
ncbi:MAG: HAD family hydrolase [Candidatus Heimdallarchaeota archaeon]